MNDRPTSTELLRAVGRFLREEVVPSLEGPRRYHARVAANVVAIVAREIETEEGHLRGEWERLSGLLPRERELPVHGTEREPPVHGPEREPPGERETLREEVRVRNEDLSQRIRAGDADTGPFREAVFAHLRRTVADKLEVAKPPKEG